jgi:hypothetical protein
VVKDDTIKKQEIRLQRKRAIHFVSPFIFIQKFRKYLTNFNFLFQVLSHKKDLNKVAFVAEAETLILRTIDAAQQNLRMAAYFFTSPFAFAPQ